MTDAKGPYAAVDPVHPDSRLPVESAQVKGGPAYPDLPGCVHCGEPVRETGSPYHEVEHYDPRASFNDSRWWYCQGTVATMPAGTG